MFIEKALNNGLLKVFDNGFVLYESMGRHTVLRADLTWETFRNNYRKYGGADDSVNWTVLQTGTRRKYGRTLIQKMLINVVFSVF